MTPPRCCRATATSRCEMAPLPARLPACRARALPHLREKPAPPQTGRSQLVGRLANQRARPFPAATRACFQTIRPAGLQRSRARLGRGEAGRGGARRPLVSSCAAIRRCSGCWLARAAVCQSGGRTFGCHAEKRRGRCRCVGGEADVVSPRASGEWRRPGPLFGLFRFSRRPAGRLFPLRVAAGRRRRAEGEPGLGMRPACGAEQRLGARATAE